ncbi:MAG: DUF3343 domain-containing protein [Syntrophomonadaceae bacterium]|nr:DUF3343 domain-containing protein [Syntrophomonadaceae bacterium]
MNRTLFNLKEYGVFTFISTSQALKAERVLKQASIDFLMMPTPREISTSCGLAVKVASEDLGESSEVLRQNRVQVDGAYQVSQLQGKTRTERVIDG